MKKGRPIRRPLMCAHRFAVASIARDDVNSPPAAIKLNKPVDHGENGIVRAHADASTWPELSPDLSHQNVAGPHRLPAKTLHPTPLSVRITAVSGGTLTFLVSHYTPTSLEPSTSIDFWNSLI
jgi:hypothetical protein